MRTGILAATCAALVCPAQAEGLKGQSYIIELTSSQYASGLGEYLVPPLAAALERAGLRPEGGPGADLVVNILWETDVGQWMGKGADREWVYTTKVTVGISPADYVIPQDGTPRFGMTAVLLTLNPDRDDQLDCMIRLATRTAVANYRPEGHLKTDGQSCIRN